jgi:hypothetical protein
MRTMMAVRHVVLVASLNATAYDRNVSSATVVFDEHDLQPSHLQRNERGVMRRLQMRLPEVYGAA